MLSAAQQDLRSLPLGQLLVQAGLLTGEQLHQALQVQAAEGGPLGQGLVQLGYISDRDLAHALADQFGMTYEKNPDEGFSPQVATLADEALIRRHLAIPLRMENGRLVLGMVYPGNLGAIDDFASLCRSRVTPVIITQQALERLLVMAFRLHDARESAESQEPEVKLVDEHEIARIVAVVSDLLEQGLGQGASDIHFEPMPDALRVRFRLDGVMNEVIRLPSSLSAGLVSRIKVMAGLDISERRLPQDGRFEMVYKNRHFDLRTATLPSIFGEKVTIRVLDQSMEIRKPGDLGLPPWDAEKLLRMSRRSNGMLLITGPTGSGKTTTLTSLLADLNTPERHIVTLEDPVEYQIPGTTQVQVNVKAGLSFANGLRSFLRHDPDVIMVGEIRDTETVQLAVRAALTGHLVLTTLHTNSAAGAVVRLIDMGMEPYLVASAMTGVVAQRLVRRLCPRCKRPREMERAAPGPLASLLQGATLYEAVGCNYCNSKGYRGRLGLYELLPVSPVMAETISRPGVTAAEVERIARSEGMQTLLEYGAAKAAAGETSLEELRRVLLAEV